MPSRDVNLDVVVLAGSRVALGDTTTVQRVLPRRQRSTVGPWCFADVIGPNDLDGGTGMVVGPHPHVGLQTVTWLFDGEVLHRDSLGSEQVIRAGELNVMTSGYGIAHSEHSTVGGPPRLQGLQLWVALPAELERAPASFAHHPELPSGVVGGAEVTVLMGEFGELVSPAAAYSPIVGAHIRLPRSGRVDLPLVPGFEHALIAIDSGVLIDGVVLPVGSLGALGEGRDGVLLSGPPGAMVVLLGGAARVDPLVMWWNFVGASAAVIETARAEWEAGDERFGPVPGGERRIPAPPLPPGRLKARSVNRVVDYP